jgi:hypothetical protein
MHRSMHTASQGTALLAYGVVADEVRFFATRILERMQSLQERYPCPELDHAIQALSEWQNQLAPEIRTHAPAYARRATD